MPRAGEYGAKLHSAGRRGSGLEKRPSIAHIAFAPETEQVPEEMLQLVDTIEHQHHPDDETEGKKRGSKRDSLLEKKDSLIIPVGQHAHLLTVPSQMQFQTINNSKDKRGSDSKDNKTSSGVFYDHIPRPYVKHWIDIERRRARKMIDIMTATQEVFEFSEKDKRVKFPPSGTLIFHVLELFNLDVNTTTFIKSLPVSFYCVLNMGGILKRCSKIFHSKTSRRIRVDYAANFSVDISEWRESPLNRFSLELWSYQDPETHYIVGALEIHAYKFIRKQHAIEVQQLWSDGIKVGTVAFEYAFAYGSFGYGHSNHLKNPNNPIMETVCHSMYPRIRLGGKDIADKVYRVRMPSELKLFTYNSLILETDLKRETGTEAQQKKQQNKFLEPKPMIVQQVTFEDDKPVHCKLHMNIWQKEIQADLNDAYGEYVCHATRKSRMDYMTNLTSGRMRDVLERDHAAYLFRPFKDREAERVAKLEVRPGYLVFPHKIPCHDPQIRFKLDKEDEKFQEQFPAVRRENGYLSTIFGFSPKPDVSCYLNDMDYPLYKEAGKVKWRLNFSCFTRFLLRIGAFLNLLYNFIFPEIHTEPVIPEISVTTASPQGSTTNVFTYFVRDEKETGIMDKVEKLQAQTAALIDMTEHPYADFDEDDSDLSSSDEENAQSDKKKLPKTGAKQNAAGEASQKEDEIFMKPVTGPHFKAGLNQPITERR